MTQPDKDSPLAVMRARLRQLEQDVAEVREAYRTTASGPAHDEYGARLDRLGDYLTAQRAACRVLEHAAAKEAEGVVEAPLNGAEDARAMYEEERDARWPKSSG